LTQIDVQHIGPEISFYGIDRTQPTSTAGGQGVTVSVQNPLFGQVQLFLELAALQQHQWKIPLLRTGYNY